MSTLTLMGYKVDENGNLVLKSLSAHGSAFYHEEYDTLTLLQYVNSKIASRSLLPHTTIGIGY